MNNMLTWTTTPSAQYPLEQQHMSAIVCTPVPDEQRIGFWPQHFGAIPQWITLEPRTLAGWTVSAKTTVGASGSFIR